MVLGSVECRATRSRSRSCSRLSHRASNLSVRGPAFSERAMSEGQRALWERPSLVAAWVPGLSAVTLSTGGGQEGTDAGSCPMCRGCAVTPRRAVTMASSFAWLFCVGHFSNVSWAVSRENRRYLARSAGRQNPVTTSAVESFRSRRGKLATGRWSLRGWARWDN